MKAVESECSPRKEFGGGIKTQGTRSVLCAYKKSQSPEHNLWSCHWNLFSLNYQQSKKIASNVPGITSSKFNFEIKKKRGGRGMKAFCRAILMDSVSSLRKYVIKIIKIIYFMAPFIMTVLLEKALAVHL